MFKSCFVSQCLLIFYKGSLSLRPAISRTIQKWDFVIEATKVIADWKFVRQIWDKVCGIAETTFWSAILCSWFSLLSSFSVFSTVTFIMYCQSPAEEVAIGLVWGQEFKDQRETKALQQYWRQLSLSLGPAMYLEWPSIYLRLASTNQSPEIYNDKCVTDLSLIWLFDISSVYFQVFHFMIEGQMEIEPWPEW